MGRDATYYPPAKAAVEDILSFLEFMGFSITEFEKPDDVLQSTHECYYFDGNDYIMYEGVVVWIIQRDGKITLWSRTTIWRSWGDDLFHNEYLYRIKQALGGYFITDYGRGNLFPVDGVLRKKAEAGCFYARRSIHNYIAYISMYINMLEDALKENEKTWSMIPFQNPHSLGLTMSTTYLVGVIEEYFKKSFIALLKYSDKKLSFLKNFRPLPEDLVGVSQGESTIEWAITKSMSFQNISRICLYFKDMDGKIDLYGLLNSMNYNGRSYFSILDELLNARHSFVHSFNLDHKYTSEDIKSYYNVVELTTKEVFNYIASIYNWETDGY